MTSQLNPAWQRRPLSSNHLAEISARFLSSEARPAPAAERCQVISFLLEDERQEEVVRELAHALAQQGQACRWRRLGPARTTTADPTSAADANTLHLVTTTSVTDCLAQPADPVVVLVPASLSGLRNAYLRIKQLSAFHCPDVAVLLLGPRDQHAAWRYFRKLAVGTLRFLDIPLLNLGFLPATDPAGQTTPEQRRQLLGRVGARLLRSGCHRRYTGPGTTGDRQAS